MSEAKRARGKWSKAINFVCDDNSLSADYIEELEKENAKLWECVGFYTHEKVREGYGCEKVAGVMPGHRYDIACGACNEESKGKKARETLKELEGGE